MVQKLEVEKMLHAKLTQKIIGSCFDVMNELGVGFFESVYKKALIVLLLEKGLSVREEVPYQIIFHGINIGRYIADVIVEENVIVELKVCKTLLPEHQAQVINYLKVSNISVGLLVNFGDYNLDIKRIYN